MQFEGATLHGILLHQAEPVLVIDATGRTCTMPGPVAARMLGDDMVGVGNRRRIRFVKPCDITVANARQRKSDVKAVVQQHVVEHDSRLDPVHRNPQGRGAKLWQPQHTRARTGQGGGIVRLLFEKN